MNKVAQLFLAIFASALIGCSGMTSLKEGTVFEAGNYYGVFENDELWICSKDMTTSVSLGQEVASINLGESHFIVKHKNGEYERHVIRRLNEKGVFDESGKAIVRFAD